MKAYLAPMLSLIGLFGSLSLLSIGGGLAKQKLQLSGNPFVRFGVERHALPDGSDHAVDPLRPRIGNGATQ